ncbi:DUF4007 family protein [Tepidibacter hydrothermalis]|uniref:DUF4007 family protein n=1 Tax=Tepidibacter hydrothermalis TaxID=3036126 RepID=A0ABY8EJW5_9FIRM|nr:DUF4007 family protein [Tepidibacter hydrothermalis]WFD11308.1 DUF4007 family protein [Tepidibacter hydrothermalis]
MSNITKIKIKGHESFYIREGWLSKGMKSINEDSSLFSNKFATDTLGVGSNMVKSIRYWLQVCGLTEEISGYKGKREQFLTDSLGRIIFEKDPYFEDIFSLWLVHYKLASNRELSTTWYLFYNDFKVEEFTKEDLLDGMKLALDRIDANLIYSEKSLQDDCSCLIKTYCLDDSTEKNPEDNLICPLTDIVLIKRKKTFDKREYYVKCTPSIDKLDKLVILYVILDNIKDNKTTIDSLLNNNCNVGKIFNLNRNILNEYLDILKNDGYIEINRTAGLDTIYVKDITKEEVLNRYYEQL